MLRRLIPSSMRPTDLAALGFVLAAVAGAVVWAATDAADDWMPNLSTELFSIAVTISVVQWIVGREERARLAPLLRPSLDHLKAEFFRFVDAVAEDYATTHAATFKPLPTEPFALLKHWLDEQDTADLPHRGLLGDEKTLRDMGYEFVEQAEWHEQELGHRMDPELQAALRSFAYARRSANHWRQREGAMPEMPPEVAAVLDPERLSYRPFVAYAREFGEVLRRHAPAPAFLSVDERTIAWAEDERRYRLAELRLDAHE